MELRQLRYFLAVAERMHFTGAAQALHVSQPALSQQIRMLEEEIGVKLLERTNRRVELTPAGVAFRARALAALREVAEAASDAKQVERGEVGSINIGFVTTAAVFILPSLMDQFCINFPHAMLKLHELSPEEQLEALDKNRIDVGFSSVSSVLPSLECKLLVREKLIVALPLLHPAASRRSVDLAQFADERFLLPERGLLTGMYEEIIQACHRSGFVPKLTQPIRLAETAVCLVAGNFGIALVPESFKRLKVDGVVYRPLKHDVPVFDMYAIRRKNPGSPLVDNFWSFVESISPSENRAKL